MADKTKTIQQAARLPNRKAPSLAAFAATFREKMTEDEAHAIRLAWLCGQGKRNLAREEVAAVAGPGFHGVEYLGWHKRCREHVYYLNAGDTYAPTVLFIGARLVLGCWGDLVERGYIEENTSNF